MWDRKPSTIERYYKRQNGLLAKGNSLGVPWQQASLTAGFINRNTTDEKAILSRQKPGSYEAEGFHYSANA